MQYPTTSAPPAEDAPIYSALANDPDLCELVSMYVAETPDKIALLRSAYDASDWELLRRTAHQFKGALGSYGFDCVTKYAFALEHAVRETRNAEEIYAKLQALIAQLVRITSAPSAEASAVAR